MRKKILVKEAGIIDFIKSFFKAKSKNKESEWITSLRKKDEKLADIWVQYDQNLQVSMNNLMKRLKSRGLDTSYVEDYMKKYGIPKD